MDRFSTVPQADDPELAGHALWNQEIADDLERAHPSWTAEDVKDEVDRIFAEMGGK